MTSLWRNNDVIIAWCVRWDPPYVIGVAQGRTHVYTATEWNKLWRRSNFHNNGAVISITKYCYQFVVNVTPRYSYLEATQLKYVKKLFHKAPWYSAFRARFYLTHPPLDKMAAVSQTTFSSAVSWIGSIVFWFEFHEILFLRVQLATTQHWLR